MIFKIETKDDAGNITFSGSASEGEAGFLLTVGVNYLLANGAMPLLTGKSDEELAIVSPPASSLQ
jgi:hypothetical protein